MNQCEHFWFYVGGEKSNARACAVCGKKEVKKNNQWVSYAPTQTKGE